MCVKDVRPNFTVSKVCSQGLANVHAAMTSFVMNAHSISNALRAYLSLILKKILISRQILKSQVQMIQRHQYHRRYKYSSWIVQLRLKTSHYLQQIARIFPKVFLLFHHEELRKWSWSKRWFVTNVKYNRLRSEETHHFMKDLMIISNPKTNKKKSKCPMIIM